MALDPGLIIFLLFIGISLFIAARAALKSKNRQKNPKRQYKPYQPYTQQPQTQIQQGKVQRYTPSTQQRSTQPSQPQGSRTTTTAYKTPSAQSRGAASADEYFRAGMYDRAKDEYLKTGRVFGAAKSIAAKGIEFTKDSLSTIRRYAPEREEEMVRNLSRYFFDSGEVETSAAILHEYGFKDEADAVLATIGKSYEDIMPSEVIEVSAILTSDQTKEDDRTAEAIHEELSAISSESIDPFASISTETSVKDEEEVSKRKRMEPQPLKIATTDLDERCSVCMGTIKGGESFVRCPFCDKPAHYSHLVEWLKVKSQCPNCRKKLVTSMFQGS